MMHDREKSDPAVVAVKPVNNAERSAAGSVEPRAGALGRLTRGYFADGNFFAVINL